MRLETNDRITLDMLKRIRLRFIPKDVMESRKIIKGSPLTGFSCYTEGDASLIGSDLYALWRKLLTLGSYHNFRPFITERAKETILVPEVMEALYSEIIIYNNFHNVWTIFLNTEEETYTHGLNLKLFCSRILMKFGLITHGFIYRFLHYIDSLLSLTVYELDFQVQYGRNQRMDWAIYREKFSMTPNSHVIFVPLDSEDFPSEYVKRIEMHLSKPDFDPVISCGSFQDFCFVRSRGCSNDENITGHWMKIAEILRRMNPPENLTETQVMQIIDGYKPPGIRHRSDGKTNSIIDLLTIDEFANLFKDFDEFLDSEEIIVKIACKILTHFMKDKEPEAVVAELFIVRKYISMMDRIFCNYSKETWNGEKMFWRGPKLPNIDYALPILHSGYCFLLRITEEATRICQIVAKFPSETCQFVENHLTNFHNS